jgi:hypothetical protein
MTSTFSFGRRIEPLVGIDLLGSDGSQPVSTDFCNKICQTQASHIACKQMLPQGGFQIPNSVIKLRSINAGLDFSRLRGASLSDETKVGAESLRAFFRI